MPIAHLNGHEMYYEVLGQGEPVLCMGGWGTFCHENHSHLARGLTDRYQVIVFDYRGIRDSDDDLAVPSTMELHANDAIGAILDQIAFDDAIATVRKFIAAHPDTLLIVTTDHGTGGFNVNGLGSQVAGASMDMVGGIAGAKMQADAAYSAGQSGMWGSIAGAGLSAAGSVGGSMIIGGAL